MRELKFKAWNDRTKAWLHFTGDTFAQYEHSSTVLSLESDDPITLVQYTGLKDKNGVEIYEGDIAQIQQPTSIVGGQIVFREGAFAFLSKPWHNGERDVVFMHSIKYRNNWKIEVIGNIYENPELLN